MERTSAKNCAAQSGPHVNSAVPGHLMVGSLSERCVVSHSDISEAPAGTTRPTRAMRRSPSLLGHPRGKHVAYIKRKRKQSHQEMRHTPGQMNEAGAKGTRHTARPQIRCFVELSRPWSGDDMQDSSLFMSVNLKVAPLEVAEPSRARCGRTAAHAGSVDFHKQKECTLK